MQTKHEILLLPEVAERLRVSTATINRLLALRRKGQGDFPLPISNNQAKSKGRWLANDIDDYIESLSNVKVTPPVPPKRNHVRNYQQRQELAKAGLEERHRKTKGK